MDTTTLPNLVTPSDGALLAAFAESRREEAFAEIVRRHGGMVLSVCRSVLGNTQDAEDAAQAAFLTLARKADSSTVQSRLVGWLHRVAWYVAARGAEARATRRRHEREAALMRPELRTPEEESVPLEALHAGLNDLPESYRVALILHHIEGRSHKEAAALVGCSPDAIAVRLHRGREMLRKRLGKAGVPVTASVLVGGGISFIQAAVPETFVAATTKAALLGSVTMGAVSGPVLALSQSAMNMLFWARLKTAAAVLLAAGLMASVAVTATLRASRLVQAVDSVPTIAESPPSPSLAAAPLVASAPTATAPPAEAGFVTGVIQQIGEGSVTVRRRGGEMVTVAFDKTTAFRVNNKVGSAADLKVGMGAAIFFESGMPAREIRALSDDR